MKKTVLIIVTMASIALIGTQVLACYWDNYWGGQMAGYYGTNYQKFYDQTTQLRQELAAKQGEYSALMATPNPDPKKAAELSREIATLHDKLVTQARSYNLPLPNPGYYGHMRSMGGYGWCW